MNSSSFAPGAAVLLFVGFAFPYGLEILIAIGLLILFLALVVIIFDDSAVEQPSCPFISPAFHSDAQRGVVAPPAPSTEVFSTWVAAGSDTVESDWR